MRTGAPLLIEPPPSAWLVRLTIEITSLLPDGRASGEAEDAHILTRHGRSGSRHGTNHGSSRARQF